MRFIKEYVVIIVILVIVLGIEFFTKNKLDYSMKLIRDEIRSIENKVSEQNQKEAEIEFYKLKSNWADEYKNLALFVEHNELEKVSNDIATIEANFKTSDEDMLMENIAELKFMLDHIQEKSKFNLKNIF